MPSELDEHTDYWMKRASGEISGVPVEPLTDLEIVKHIGNVSYERPFIPKKSLTIGNVANRISEHVTKKWPEFAYPMLPCFTTNLWFTGSQVWSFLYGNCVDDTHDWDMIICSGEGEWGTTPENLLNTCKTELLRYMGWDKVPQRSVFPYMTEDKKVFVGTKYLTPKGDVDLWTHEGTIQSALNQYPSTSHSHCRTAWSFTQGLVVLPNEMGWYV